MDYINKNTKEILDYKGLTELYSSSSIPKDEAEQILDYMRIYPSAKPKTDAITEKLVEVEPTLTDGKYYNAYEIVACTQEEIDVNTLVQYQTEVKSVETAITKLIQDEINTYNLANNVVFKDINAIQKYTIDDTYTHYTFCNSILVWNIIVWETVRQIQIDIATGARDKPTLEVIISEIPERI